MTRTLPPAATKAESTDVTADPNGDCCAGQMFSAAFLRRHQGPFAFHVRMSYPAKVLTIMTPDMDQEYRQLHRTVQTLRRQRDSWQHTQNTMQQLLGHLHARKRRLYTEQQQLSTYTERVLDGLMPVVQRMQRFGWPAVNARASDIGLNQPENDQDDDSVMTDQPGMSNIMSRPVETRQDVIEYLNSIKLVL